MLKNPTMMRLFRRNLLFSEHMDEAKQVEVEAIHVTLIQVQVSWSRCPFFATSAGVEIRPRAPFCWCPPRGTSVCTTFLRPNSNGVNSGLDFA